MKERKTQLNEDELSAVYSKNTLTKELKEKVNELIKECGCICHKSTAMHMMPCCQVTYRKLFTDIL